MENYDQFHISSFIVELLIVQAFLIKRDGIENVSEGLEINHLINILNSLGKQSSSTFSSSFVQLPQSTRWMGTTGHRNYISRLKER